MQKRYGLTVRWRRLRATSTGNPIRRRMPAVLSNGMPGRCRENQTWTGLAVVLKATGAVIGDCAFYLDGDRAEIGCNISPAYQRRGLAREALQTLVAYCAEVYKVALIRGITDSRNFSSIRLQESLGMVRDRTVENRIQCKGETCTEYRFEGDCRAIFSPERTTI